MRLINQILVFICIGVSTSLVAQSSELAPLEEVVERILSKEGHKHGHYHFHEHPLLCAVDTKNDNLNLYLETAEAAVETELYDHLLESFLPVLERYSLKELVVFIKTKNWTAYQDLSKLATSKPIPVYKSKKNNEPYPSIRKSSPKGRRQAPVSQQRKGALAGKTIWLSPGHGWKADNAAQNWLTQRGNTNDYVEDFGTVEGVNYYLQQYLRNAGANVWMVRERDVNTNEVIVDNDDGAPRYMTMGNWATSGTPGYQGKTYQFTGTNTQETALAMYRPTIPESGWYWVSVYYREGSNRPINAKYRVKHAGGETSVFVNQEVHGLTWNYIGQFYFEKGDEGMVMLSNQSRDSKQAVIADAVRFGGGMGSTTDCTYDSAPSGRPRFEEAARQYAPFQGYPECEGDVTIRPKYAEWELSKGTEYEKNNALYLAWHSNAFDGTARGTVTYTYNGSGETPITAGSADLAQFIQAELANDIKGAWDSDWKDRGTNTANFGELRELQTMPGCLVELAFHDNEADATALKTPDFRNLSARAMYQGIVRFFADRDGAANDLLPEPPSHLLAKNTNSGIRLEWQAPDFGNGVVGDQATGYKVYVSTHGRGFPEGKKVTGTSYELTNLVAGQTYYFKITATNAGGESFPTAIVAARTPMSNQDVTHLIIDGFDRLDRASAVNQFESSALNNVDRMFLERMNSFDYMVDHAAAYDYCGYAFDGASNEAVIAEMIDLDGYDGLDWITGEESTADRTLDSTEQSLLANYLDNGGNLIISGAEIGWDIGRASSANAAVDFYTNYLKTSYVGDDAESYAFSGVSGTIFGGTDGLFDDGSNGIYHVEYPDRLAPFGGATTVLRYEGGTGDAAAIAYRGIDFGVVNFGFPLEAVTDVAVRANLICDAINTFTSNTCALKRTITEVYDSTSVKTVIVKENIQASNTQIPKGANIIYNAGQSVDLEKGFEVKKGAEFMGKTEGCDKKKEGNR